MEEHPQPSRRSREDLKALVMQAALDLVRTEGLGAVPTTLSYQRVFAHLEATTGVRVTRASVHERIWGNQDDFRLEALIAARPWNITTPETTLLPALEVLETTRDWPPLDRMREMTRVAAEVAQVTSEEDPVYYSWVGMTMAMAKDPSIDPDHRQSLVSAVRDAYSGITTRFTGLLEGLGEALGVRPKADLFASPAEGWSLIVKLGTALSEGATVRTRLDDAELPPVMLATGRDGELQEWTPFAAGYWALLQTYLEVDPDAGTGPAD